MRATGPLAEPGPPARDPLVWTWAVASFLSFLGDYVWIVGLAWAAVHVATPAVAGVVLGVGLVPQALLLLYGGSVADRYDTRRVLVLCNAVRIAALLAGALAWQAGASRVPTLVALAVVLGAADAIYQPTNGTLPRQMVRPEHLGQLGGLFQVTRRVAAFAGAALGGAIAATSGIVAAMLVNATTFLAISVALATVLRPRYPVHRDATEPTLRAIRAGLAYVRGNGTVRTLTITLSGLNVFVGPALSIGIALRVSQSHWGAGVVGAAEAAVGVGAAIGAVVAMRSKAPYPARTAFLVLVVQGIGIAGTGIPVLPVVLSATLLIGLTAGYASVQLSATFIRTIRPDQLGRVQSMTMLADYSLLPLATPFFGWFAHTTSTAAAAGVFGLGMVLLSAWGGSRPAVRRLRVEDVTELEPAAAEDAEDGSAEAPPQVSGAGRSGR